MKNKLLIAVMSAACATACACVFTACGGGDAHKHTFDTDNWIGGEDGHWHESTCGHDVTTTSEAHIDADNNGECDVCEYPMDVTVGGTYYYCENDELNDQLYITFNAGVWTDDEGLTGNYTVSSATVTLYMDIDGEREEFTSGTVNGNDITLDLLGAELVYRKGKDIGSVQQAKTLQFELSADTSYYTVKGIGGLTGGEITVPDKYKNKPVKAIADNAFANNRSITKLVIGNNVQTVGLKAFNKCTALQEVVFGEKVEEIGISAFEQCSALEKITLSKSVKHIRGDAFENCRKLVDIYYTGTASDWAGIEFAYSVSGNNLSTVSNPLFDEQSNKSRKLYINDELVTEADIDADEIMPCAFYGYTYLTRVAVNDGVTAVGDFAFEGCADIGALYLGSGIVTIGKSAFSGCKNVPQIRIAQSVVKIDAYAFYGLEKITALSLGNNVRYIGSYAFASCEKLAELSLGSSVVEIGEYAFTDCYLLTSVTIPESVIFIGKGTFMDSGLTGATFAKTTGWIANKDESLSSEQLSDPATAASLLQSSYLANGYGDTDWEQPTLQYTLSSDKSYYIVNNAGTACRAEIEIPTTYKEKPVRALADYAFNGCKNLTSISLPSCLMSIGNNAFTGCTALESIEVRGALSTEYEDYYTSMDGVLFSADYSQIICMPAAKSAITIDYITEIPDRMFEYNTMLKKVVIGNSVTSIGDRVFAGCSSLTSITISKSVTSIGNSVFSECNKLYSISVADDNPNYSSQDGILYNKAKTEIVHVPKAIEGALTIPYTVKSIGEGVFYGRNNLTSVEIPKSVTSIGNEAFYGRCLTIYCNVSERPDGWHSNWVSSNCPVVWNCKNNDKDENGYAYAIIGGIRYRLKDGVATVIRQPRNISAAIISAGVTYKNASYNVTSIESGAFADCDSLTSITYTGDIKGWCEIDGLSNIMSFGASNKTLTIDGNEISGELVIPNTVTSIPSYAFYGCNNISSITIPNSVTNIGTYAFSGCSSLMSITIPNSVTSIGRYVFQGCSSLTSVTIPSSVTKIESMAFYLCEGLASITYTGDIKGWCEIDGLSNLMSYGASSKTLTIDGNEIAGMLVIPNTVTSIPSYSFYGCSGLTSIEIPDSVTSIGSNAFKGCDSLASITYTGDIKSWCEISGLDGLMSYGTSSKTLTINGNEISGTLVIPNTVTSIASYAFFGCSGLNSIEIPDCVTSIGSNAFYGCPIETATIPALAAEYVNNSQLKTVVITSGESIGNFAFRNCSSLTSITIPSSVTSIGSDGSFSGCSSLTSIIYTGNIKSWCEIDKLSCLMRYGASNKTLIIDGKEIVGILVIPESVTSIGSHAFYNCSSITSVTMPNSVTSIGMYAFYGCSSLASVALSNRVTNIDYGAFYNCSSLTSITIPNSVTSIDRTSFSGCPIETATIPAIAISAIKNSALETVVITSGESIDNYAFSGCNNLTSVTIPNSVVSIGQDAFKNCSSLTSITYTGDLKGWCEIEGLNNLMPYGAGNKTLTIDGNEIAGTLVIPNTVTSIGSSAFYNCSSITGVTIPYSVTSISYTAFSGCLIESATIPALAISAIKYCPIKTVVITSGDSINDSAFSGCDSITSVTIPNSVISVGEEAFKNCSSLTSVTIPNSVISIGSGAFRGCIGLESITLPFIGGSATETTASSSTLFGYIFGQTIYTGGISAQQYYSNDSYVTYYIPESLKNVTITGGDILYGAFYNCSKLTSITIGGDATSIGDCAFANCSNLTSIEIPASVTSIGNSAFTSGIIETATIPASAISAIQFRNYSTLKSVTITSGDIGNRAFSNCSKITSITIADSVTSVGHSIINDTPYYQDESNWENGVLYIGKHLIDAKTTISGAYTIKQDTLTLANSAFFDCSSLTDITFPRSVTYIGGAAFSGCSSLTSVTIPSSVTSVGLNVFLGCNSLSSITYTGNIKDWCERDGLSELMYYGASSKTLTVDGKEVTGAIVIPDGVTGIREGAFALCSSITSIMIPVSVTSIGKIALSGCSGLTSIIFNGTIDQWNTITKGSSWDKNTGNYTITCTDGTISKDGTVTKNP